jgi:hypothetical protein
MNPRYAHINYDRLHRSAEIIFRMVMVRLRVNLKTHLRESARRCGV